MWELLAGLLASLSSGMDRLISLEFELVGTCFQLLGLLLGLVAFLLVLLAGLVLLIKVAVPKPALLSLPYSHYVELARWSLDARGLPYTELKMPVGPHVVVFGLLRLLFRGNTSISSFPGSDGTAYAAPWAAWLRRLSGTPALITRESGCLPDSWAIMAYANRTNNNVSVLELDVRGEGTLYATRPSLTIDDAFRLELDETVGPAVRQIAYSTLFSSEVRAAGWYRRLQANACGRVEMALFDLCESVFRLSTTVMPKMMDLSPEGVEAAAAKLREVFGHVTTILEGDPYLGDGSGAEAFGGADLAWAALTGWLLLPPGYLDGACGALPTPADLPAEGIHSKLRRELKETRAGRHVALCYGAHRRPVVGRQVTYSGILRGR